MEWWSYGDSLSAGADVLQDRGPGEGHQTAAGGMGKKSLKVLFHLHISSIVFSICESCSFSMRLHAGFPLVPIIWTLHLYRYFC